MNRHPTVINWVIPIVTLIALVMIYAGVQLYNDNINQRTQIQAFKARGCPETFHGKRFTFSAYENVNVTRPKYARLACYYQKGTMS